jgi:SAM-dependent methyltransferase
MQRDVQRTYWENKHRRRGPRHPASEAFSRPKLEYARKHMPDLGVATVLDVGAGNGFFTWLLDAWGSAIAVDFAATMLRQHPSRRKVQADAAALPFADRSVDVAFCGNLLHHLADPQAAVNELARVARRYVVLVEPNRNNPLMLGFGLLKRAERGTIHLHRGEIVRMLELAGVEVVASTTLGTVLPNMTPDLLLPLARLIDGESPLGFYAVAVGKVR